MENKPQVSSPITYDGIIFAVVLFLLSLSLVDCSSNRGGSKPQARKDSVTSPDSTAPAPSATSAMTMTYEQRQGRFIYEKYCAICHGAEGRGDGFNAFNLNPKPRNFTDKKYLGASTDEKLIETIGGGGRAVNKSSLMPTWGGRLTRREIEDVVAYVRTFGE